MVLLLTGAHGHPGDIGLWQGNKRDLTITSSGSYSGNSYNVNGRAAAAALEDAFGALVGTLDTRLAGQLRRMGSDRPRRRRSQGPPCGSLRRQTHRHAQGCGESEIHVGAKQQNSKFRQEAQTKSMHMK